jgi:hypothetical protein
MRNRNVDKRFSRLLLKTVVAVVTSTVRSDISPRNTQQTDFESYLRPKRLRRI